MASPMGATRSSASSSVICRARQESDRLRRPLIIWAHCTSKACSKRSRRLSCRCGPPCAKRRRPVNKKRGRMSALHALLHEGNRATPLRNSYTARLCVVRYTIDGCNPFDRQQILRRPLPSSMLMFPYHNRIAYASIRLGLILVGLICNRLFVVLRLSDRVIQPVNRPLR
jgi:hypothetical protein